ncbi:hypothetical protein ADICYQ_2101 [Cyclobacterium qasimii M12-11B]|uniref:Uncharacterized protein n=1 Tax=Cyclobacterium qasimii M12-11B TaxID=641524 RepID=S7VET9_9BACT|nr:hypothetical protein ADICYQ_2101 [Cyclobacterium qasimii M12-11B]
MVSLVVGDAIIFYCTFHSFYHRQNGVLIIALMDIISQ